MLAIQYIRLNKDLVKEKLSVKNFEPINIIDEIIILDENVRNLKTETETMQAEMNAASKNIGLLMGQGKKDEAEAAKQNLTQIKTHIQEKTESLNTLEKSLFDKIIILPNLPHADVPLGKLAEDNLNIKEFGAIPNLNKNAKPHWDLIKDYDLVNFELGAQITGSGFALYKGKGAKLQRALINYFLDKNINAGYTEYQPPLLVNETSAFGTGQLPDKEGQMYHATVDNLFLIPTAEVPITNIYRDTIVKENELPIKMTGYTPCFRREAGSFGADVRGLNRVHQFDKVELVCLTKSEESYTMLQQMVLHVEKILQELELPYRILKLCGGDMSFASALTFDFEVYSAAQKKWLEVSSVSNFETFQTNRMKIRYKDADGKTNLCHSLNGSSLALPRIVACLLENNQFESGIKLPKCLHNYFGTDVIN